MKRNLSLLILACEIAAIIILHAVKMNQQENLETGNSISKATNPITATPAKHYPLLSIK
jgi:hypothetical protein